MGKVMSVLGEIDTAVLGKTLTHEHIFCDFTCFLLEPENEDEQCLMDAKLSLENLHIVRKNPYMNRDECVLDDMDTALYELDLFKQCGGCTITEVSLPGCGRDAVGLAEVAGKLKQYRIQLDFLPMQRIVS